ncbi:hypothetical protein GW764_01150 [Candidatus Parcubacteria bacterium]|nr:hypothetical protein [Candidatus Parcubacteria bacterium]
MNTLIILLSNGLFGYYAIINEVGIGYVLLTFLIEGLFFAFFSHRRIKKIKNFSVKDMKVNGQNLEKEDTSPENQAHFFLFLSVFSFGIVSMFLFVALFTEQGSELGLVYKHDNYIYLFILMFFLSSYFKYKQDIEKDKKREILLSTMFSLGIIRAFVFVPIIIFGPMIFQSQGGEMNTDSVLIIFFIFIKVFLVDFPSQGMNVYTENEIKTDNNI